MGTIVIFFGKNFAICRYKRTLLWVDIIVLSCSQHSVWGATGCCCTLGGFHNPLQHLTTSDRDGFHTPLWHSWSGGSLSHRGRYSSEWMQTVGVSSVSSKKKKDLLVHLLGQGGGDGGPGVLAVGPFPCPSSDVERVTWLGKCAVLQVMLGDDYCKQYQIDFD